MRDSAITLQTAARPTTARCRRPAGGATSTPRAAGAPPPPDAQAWQLYTVQPDDTLSTIAGPTA